MPLKTKFKFKQRKLKMSKTLSEGKLTLALNAAVSDPHNPETLEGKVQNTLLALKCKKTRNNMNLAKKKVNKLCSKQSLKVNKTGNSNIDKKCVDVIKEVDVESIIKIEGGECKNCLLVAEMTWNDPLNTNLSDESYIEEEIFFGPISSKEEKLIEMWKNRKTEYYSPSRFQNLDLYTEKMVEERKSSVEQDSDILDILKSVNTCNVQNFNCQLSDSDMTNADEHLVRKTNLELSDCEDSHLKSDTRHDTFVEYDCDKIIEDLDNNLKCTQNYINTAHYNTPKSRRITTIVGSSCPRKLVNTPTSTKLPIYSNYKQRKDDTPSHINSPLVKTVTKSKIESYTRATNRKDINRDIYSNTAKNINTAHYNTTKSRGITTIVGSSCPSKLVNTPTSTKFTSQNLALNSSNNKASLSQIPRVTYGHNVFSTPQDTTPKVKMTASKSVQPRSRHRTLNIESPVANYLQNNPPPPLVTTVKPRYNVSPLRLQTETAPENFRKTPLKESNIQSKPEMITSRLLPAVHKQGEGFLVNKENISTKRKFPGDRPPVILLKHKGRMKLPKDTILKNEKDSPCLMTNNKTEEIINTEKIDERETGRESLMEISIYEQHLVRHSNTLK